MSKTRAGMAAAVPAHFPCAKEENGKRGAKPREGLTISQKCDTVAALKLAALR